jgi:hypothetical protein
MNTPNPKVDAARKWAAEFRPKTGVDYDWVYQLAVARFQRLKDANKNLDDKAASIATAIGGGTGIFTLGSIAALTSGTVNPWVVGFALISVILAVGALCVSIGVRKTKGFPNSPEITYAAQCVQELSDQGNPKAALIGAWHVACEETTPILDKKADRLDLAFRLFAWAIAALILPIAAGVIIHAIKDSEKKEPTDIRIYSPVEIRRGSAAHAALAVGLHGGVFT